MNSLLLLIVLIPAIEIYLFIKIGAVVGAFNTVLLIFFTAFVGIYYARAEGLNTLNHGLKKMVKNEMPAYELISGALIAIGAIFLILPGFATDTFGFLLLMPWTRKIIVKSFIKKQNTVKTKSENYIEGEIVEKENNKDDI